MRLFLTILEGPNPREASPILATEDAALIRAVAAQITDRLAGERNPGAASDPPAFDDFPILTATRRGQA